MLSEHDNRFASPVLPQQPSFCVLVQGCAKTTVQNITVQSDRKGKIWIVL